MTYRVVIIGCGSAKSGEPQKVRDLYTGGLTQAAMAYAQAEVDAGRADEWCVLSGKYGLLSPDWVIKPYNQKLPTNEDSLMAWIRGVDMTLRLGRGELRFWSFPDGIESYSDSFENKIGGWLLKHPEVHFEIHCGAEYEAAFRRAVGMTAPTGQVDAFSKCKIARSEIAAPLAGLQVGERLHWYKEAREAA